MKVDFYYVRHGQTIFNQIGRMQGSCDSPLTSKGIEDAEDTASALRNISFQHAFTSSSERALKTAQMICKYHDMEPVCMKELKEFDFGDLDGEPIEKFKSAIWGEKMRDDWTEYHGESSDLFDKRSRKAFHKILEQCKDGENVLIVSHGSYIMHLMKTLLNFDQEAYVEKRNAENKPWMPNCGICVFTYEDGNWSMKEEPMSAQEFRLLHDKKTIHYYFVRHGETLFNLHHRLQGQCDSPLTEKGIQQVIQTKEKLKQIHFQHTFISTSERTRDTADILLEGRQVKTIIDDRLKEIYFGELEGSHYLENQEMQNQRFNEVHYSDIGGEDAQDVKKRLRQFLRDTTDICEDGENVLLVSHANIYTILLEEFFQIDRKNLYQESHQNGINPTPNAGLCRFTYQNGDWILEEMMTGEKYG